MALLRGVGLPRLPGPVRPALLARRQDQLALEIPPPPDAGLLVPERLRPRRLPGRGSGAHAVSCMCRWCISPALEAPERPGPGGRGRLRRRGRGRGRRPGPPRHFEPLPVGHRLPARRPAPGRSRLPRRRRSPRPRGRPAPGLPARGVLRCRRPRRLGEEGGQGGLPPPAPDRLALPPASDHRELRGAPTPAPRPRAPRPRGDSRGFPPSASSGAPWTRIVTAALSRVWFGAKWPCRKVARAMVRQVVCLHQTPPSRRPSSARESSCAPHPNSGQAGFHLGLLSGPRG